MPLTKERVCAKIIKQTIKNRARYFGAVMDKSKNIHAGHRDRLKKRFLREGLDAFEEHNIIELLLFFGIPFKDTNDIAHELLLRFGSISNLLDANIEDIMQVKGVGENAAILIKLIPSVCRIYLEQKDGGFESCDNIDKLGKMLCNKYLAVNVETVMLTLLDNAYRVISVEKVFEGSVNSAQVSTRKLVELALLKNASMVVISHNHPNGIAVPSIDDLETTTALMHLFDAINTPLLEHILVADNTYTPIIYNQLGERRLLPDSSTLSSSHDLSAFYNIPIKDKKR